MASEEINSAWKSACRIILGAEIGGLDDYKEYLAAYVDLPRTQSSVLSGKPIFVSSPNFSPGSRFISNDEMAESNARMQKEKLSINSIKDIDSLSDAMREKICYSGNIITGNSNEVEESDICIDSSYVFASNEVFGCRYVASSCNNRIGEWIFGCNWTGESKFIVKCHQTYRLTRSWETLRTFLSSDCYYTANLEGCSNCIFSFNQRNRRNMVGNNELPLQQYEELKAKLLGEFRQTLKAKKMLPSIVSIISD